MLLPDLLEYRELFYALASRDLRVRYKQTIVGAAWAVVQPLALMVVLTIFFGYLVRFPSDGLPYPLFALCGLLPWQLFARALNDGSMSVVANGALVQRIYFPRVILPGVVDGDGDLHAGSPGGHGRCPPGNELRGTPKCGRT